MKNFLKFTSITLFVLAAILFSVSNVIVNEAVTTPLRAVTALFVMTAILLNFIVRPKDKDKK